MKKQRHFLIQFISVLVVLTAIMTQGFTHAVKMKPLFGYPKEENAVPLQFKTFFDGSFQEYLTEHAKRNTGFREFWIRSYNQWLYSVFHKISNNNIQEGEDRELFLTMYLDEITGKTLRYKFGSVETAQSQARLHAQETAVMVDTLRQHGINFLYVFAPTKTALYPEKMPKYYRDHIADFCLEEYYIELFKEYGIPHIDLYHYFQSLKDTLPYPLYTKTASHWSEYTIPIAADTILKTLSLMTGYDLPSIQLQDENVTTDYSDYDWELEKSLNLLFPWPRPALPRPYYTLSDTIGKDRPNLLVVGDSYFDQLMFSCFKDAFNSWEFWQYLKNAYSSRYWNIPFSNVKDPTTILENADIVLAVNTAPMMYNFMSDFPNKSIQWLQEKEVLKMIDNIKRNPKWYEEIVRQAEVRNITIDSCLRLNAVYFIEAHRNKQQ